MSGSNDLSTSVSVSAAGVTACRASTICFSRTGSGVVEAMAHPAPLVVRPVIGVMIRVDERDRVERHELRIGGSQDAR